MAAQTGRTVSKWMALMIDDSGGTLRTIVGLKSINGVGVEAEDVDVTAITETIKNSLPGQDDFSMTLTGHMDNTAATGFHTVFSALAGLGVPLSFDVQFGVRHAWESGEPQFGITSSATSGVHCLGYVVSPDGMEASVTVRTFGPTAPAWGTSAEA